MAQEQKERIENREITEELRESYLDYAMSVIVSRALPDVRDGLKPVHRRVLWAMWDAGLTHLAKFRKSANVVGETMGRYHPHGDLAVYDSLVRMAQDFSLRYPLVQGQGNFGSLDGDSAAAMRYTEVRLSRIAEELLADIDKETVDWTPNYDGTRKEPRVLPAKLPNLLLNGSMGIAVGMATSIPPHNLGELADAILYLAEHPKAEHDEVMRFVKGPDFPTGGVIYDAKSIGETYAAGRGTISVRARAEVAERAGSRGGFDIVITEIPYLVNKAELIAKIAELVQAKRIEGIRDLRDESDKEGLRVVLELKSDAAPQKILNQLYQHTDLQRDFHMNMIALVDGIQPQVLSLKDVLLAYLEYRKTVVRRRTEFDLSRAKERAHILTGLVKALHEIDKVIAVIKKSEDRDDAHANLTKQFELTDVQAAAILEMRLQALAHLERERLESELAEKRALIKDLELVLRSPAKILAMITNEVKELKETYGDARRTQVVAGGLQEFKDEDLVPEEDAIITLSAGGYIKRLPPGSFRSQKRGGKGLIGTEVAEEDFISHFLTAKTHDYLLFFTERGRVFQTRVYEIPAAGRTAKGKAVHNFLELPANEKVSALVSYAPGAGGADIRRYLVMATRGGLIKKTPLEEFKHIRRTGIIAINLAKGDALRWADLSDGKDEVVLATAKGQAIRFRESQVRPMGRTAAGVRAMRLRAGDAVAGFDIIRSGKAGEMRLLVIMANGFAKQTPLKQYKVQNRGGGGIRTAKITAKTGSIIGSCAVSEETDVFALSKKGQVIRTPLQSVRTTGRDAQGVRIMHVKSGDELAGAVVI